jgi:hypothetical protein
VKDNRLGGIALILGATASVATMVFHPTHFSALLPQKQSLIKSGFSWLFMLLLY